MCDFATILFTGADFLAVQTDPRVLGSQILEQRRDFSKLHQGVRSILNTLMSVSNDFERHMHREELARGAAGILARPTLPSPAMRQTTRFPDADATPDGEALLALEVSKWGRLDCKFQVLRDGPPSRPVSSNTLNDAPCC